MSDQDSQESGSGEDNDALEKLLNPPGSSPPQLDNEDGEEDGEEGDDGDDGGEDDEDEDRDEEMEEDREVKEKSRSAEKERRRRERRERKERKKGSKGEESEKVKSIPRRYRPSPGLPAGIGIARSTDLGDAAVIGRVVATFKKLTLLFEKPHFMNDNGCFASWTLESPNGVIFHLSPRGFDLETANNLKVPKNYKVDFVTDWDVACRGRHKSLLIEFFKTRMLYTLPLAVDAARRQDVGGQA